MMIWLVWFIVSYVYWLLIKWHNHYGKQPYTLAEAVVMAPMLTLAFVIGLVETALDNG